MRHFLLLFSLLLIFSTLKAQVPDFKLNRIFGSPVYFTRDVKIDKKNFTYLLEPHLINKLDSTENVVQTFNIVQDTLLGTAISLDLDKAGNMYVLMTGSKVLKFDPQGNLLLKFGSFGTGVGQLGGVTYGGGSLGVDDVGNIYVADTDNNRLQKFNTQGKFEFEYKFPTPNPSWSRPNLPVSVRVGKSGIVYILTETLDIYKLASTGKLIEKFKIVIPVPFKENGEGEAMGLDDAEQLYVAISEGAYPAKIHKLTTSGQYLISMGAAQRGPGHLWGKIGLAISRRGDIYTTSSDFPKTGRLQIFNSEGILKKLITCLDLISNITQDNQGNYYIVEGFKNFSAPIIKKYNSFGFKTRELIWPATNYDSAIVWMPVALTSDVFGYLYCLENNYNGKKSRILKFSNDGRPIAKFENFGATGETVSFSDLSLDNKGNMYVTQFQNGCVRKISPTGVFLGKISLEGLLDKPKALTVDKMGNIYVADINGDRVQKFNPDGQLLTTFNATKPNNPIVHNRPASIAVDASGYVYTWNGTEGFIRRYDASGNELGKITNAFGRLAMNHNSTKLLIATESLVREFVSGEVPQENLIMGKIYQDANLNCILDDGEKPLAGIMVQMQPGPNYAISDELGNYSIPLDTGTYTVKVVLPQDVGRTITPTCPDVSNQLLKIKSNGTLISGYNFGHQVSTAPVLNVAVVSNRRRRCMRNITTISYSNTGFASAANVKVTVQLPEHVAFISANFLHSKDNKGNYIFAVGNLRPNQRGTITIIDSVSCANPNIRGLTICTKAWITPVNTYPTPPNWNKAEITVTGKTVEYGQVRFVIRNTGTGNMTDSLFFRIYQDEDLTLNSKFKLASQDSLVLRFNPVGRAIRVEVDQPEGHPLKATAGTNVEIPAANKFGLPSLLMMAYPPDDPEPEFTEDCLPIIDSFDPNDKQVIPVGLTVENYTPTNSPLRYTIRFQNTGTDVAYRVVVVDTLSTDLDLSTFQVGAVSHGYRFTVSGKEKPVLTFTFDNIMLPDSTTDQAGSNGFIQFSIKPKANLPEKTKVENYADIFFDFNEPIRTNTTINRIYDMPQVLNTEKQLLAQNIISTPSIQTFSPTQSRAGELVTIIGKNFSTIANSNKVTFNGVAATVLSATPTTLTATVPNTAFSGKIKVVTADGAAQTLNNYIIFQPPTLTTISVTEGIPGSIVTLTGLHFSPDATLDTVTFNGIKARTLEASETTLKVEVPTGATRGKIQVKTLGGQAESSQDFRVWYPPFITDFNPGKGKAGKLITLNGNNFAEIASRNVVKFANVPAQIVETSATRLVVKVPVEAISGKIVVETPGGATSTPTDFTFIPAPIITSFTPTQGNAGTTVTITGVNFNQDGLADTVYFNQKATKVLQATETSLIVMAPKNVSSGTISVAGAGGKAVASGFVVVNLKPEEAIAIYPNPTQAKLNINWFKADFTVESLRIFNALGKLILTKDLQALPSDDLQLTVANFAAGIYTLQIQTSAGPVVKRVMVL